MPVIQVDWWRGNDRERRAELVAEVTSTVARIAGCPADAVTVIVRDVDRDHWGRGGALADQAVGGTVPAGAGPRRP
jgi:4-oxalocrotonate tautomerase